MSFAVTTNNSTGFSISLVAGSTGQVKVWDGGVWVAKPVKVWSGVAFVAKPAKVWNGSAFIATTY